MTQKDFLREENERLQNDNRNGIFHLYQDWVFHYVFGQNTRESNLALISILNMILSRENDPISEIQILNPINYRDSLSPSEQLAVYLKYRGDARYDDCIQKLITTGGDRFQMVEKVFREITDDDRIREMYWRKEIYDHDQATLRFIAEEEGLEKGLEQGEARMSALILKLSPLKRGEDIVRAASDSEFRQQLFEEFNIK